jgi:hypothetical protein
VSYDKHLKHINTPGGGTRSFLLLLQLIHLFMIALLKVNDLWKNNDYLF